jgi:hypothetical protein
LGEQAVSESLSADALMAHVRALARQTSRRHPELDARGQEMVIFEEVGTLRGRGHRGICVAGVGQDGWLANWHRNADNAANIRPPGIEQAARFALAMIETLDRG